MKVFLPSHLDAGNRGCEAIAQGTIEILGKNYDIDIISQNFDLDEKIGYENANLVDLHRHSIVSKVLNRLTYLVSKNSDAKRELQFRYKYDALFKRFRFGDVVLSTGGDMFCYQDKLETIELVDYLYKDKIPSILWGCSIGEENLTPYKISVLKKFNAIVVRESLTETMLKNKLGLKNVYCFPDPAFVLEPQIYSLPKYFFDKELVGINLSNFVGQKVDFNTLVGKNLIELFDMIIEKTELDIVLFPHVFWNEQDDRIVCGEFYNKYKSTNRVHILDTERMNYCQIRFAISKCRLFVGARTHAMISAYSTCVPALALGYSIKSIGIARDIGLPNELVVDYRKLTTNNDIKNAFCYLLEHEMGIRELLCDIIPVYKKDAYKMRAIVENVRSKTAI